LLLFTPCLCLRGVSILDPRQQISRQELWECGGSATALPRRIKKLWRKSGADVVKTISASVSLYPASSTPAAETRRIP
jgi:hypothetical protein